LTAGTNFGRAGDTLLDFTVLLLSGEFVLDGKLGFVDEGLLFEVEVMFGLYFGLVEEKERIIVRLVGKRVATQCVRGTAAGRSVK
jgi:hypothetical protein